MAIERNQAGKIIAKRFTLEEIRDADESMAGYCLACGAWRDSCEPDARKYSCEECGLNQCYGAQELVMMGRVS